MNLWFEFCWPADREKCKVSPAQRSALMGMPVSTPRTWCFGVFELDASSGELRRNGTRIKLREQPVRILLLLLEHAGQMVTREELRQHLWPSDTFVDFDHSLNSAVMKLREALGDSADKPLYIETIPKKGYRFVAPVSSGHAAIKTEDERVASVPHAPSAEPPRAPTKAAALSDPFTSEDPTVSNEDLRSESNAPSPRRSVWLPALRASAVPVLLIVAITLGTLGWRNRFLGRAAQPQIKSLAVLPLENLSGDPSQEYFAEGMTDELITELARIPALRVVSRTSVMQVQDKGVRKPLQQIADELKVDALVEGSVVRSGDKVRITAQLIDARNDKHLWAQSFESQTSDVLSLQDSVAREIASQTKTVLAPPARGDRNTMPINPAAYDAYLRGRYFLSKRDAVKSTPYFQQAISLDPSYASAYAGLADAFETRWVFGDAKTEDAMPKALAAARRAIELDPENGEAYAALGAIETDYEWNWTAAERDLTRAIALSPSYSTAELRYAIFLDATDRPEEAVTHMRRALELDPLSFFMNRHLGSTLYIARHYDEALYYLRRAGEMEPNRPDVVESWISAIYEKEGRQDDAITHDLLSLGGDHPQSEVERLRSIYQRAGWKAFWQARIDMMAPEADRYPWVPYGLGVSYLRLGDRDRAFSWFNRAVDQRCYCVTWLKVDPLVDDIRTDRRYDDLLRRVYLSQ
jgi:TolB-like protein/DNA-binding winged helix-turn-helix (wHTH) protein/Tfp pilus assembly protein PilF